LTFGAAVALAASMTPATATAQSVVYFNNFDSLPALSQNPSMPVSADDFSNFEIASAGAWNAKGWNDLYAVNRTTGNPAGTNSIMISGLMANSQVQISSMLIGFLESWDSDNGGCCSPDFLDVLINGNVVASLTTNNALGTNKIYDGGTELFFNEQINGNTYYSDALIDASTANFALSTADANGNWSIAFRASGGGWQGGSDEGWGLDNIEIRGFAADQGAVPEPATWAMLILGFGVIGASLRRRERIAFA